MQKPEFEFGNLPPHQEAAFVEIVDRCCDGLDQRIRQDRSQNSDQHDNYYGGYEPERKFVMQVLAFLDEFRIDAGLKDLSDLDNEDFIKEYARFTARLEYILTPHSPSSSLILLS